jgi:predicted NBD/HSP70 family sugar kinase
MKVESKASDGVAVLDPGGGANQSRVRDHNQRLVLSMVQRHGSLPKSEIATRTGLSAQTVTVIMRALEEDALLIRGEPVRGKVGQPSIPMSLNPDGAFSIGLKIGRRSADLMLVDLVGKQRSVLRKHFAYPTPKVITRFAVDGIENLTGSLSARHRKRLAGIGVSMPHELWHWADKIGAPQKTMDQWRDFSFSEALAGDHGLAVNTRNDATSACGAELVYGMGNSLHDFLYIFMGTFIGGGVVINHTLFPGRTGNAGALGPMPVRDRSGKFSQLIDHASVIKLEWMLDEQGIDPSPLWKNPDDWSAFSETVDQWIEGTAVHIAATTVSACSVIDFSAVVFDGAIPLPVKEKMVIACNRALAKMNVQGLIQPPQIVAGSVGSDARAIGAACLPLFERYFMDPSVLFKEQTQT